MLPARAVSWAPTAVSCCSHEGVVSHKTGTAVIFSFLVSSVSSPHYAWLYESLQDVLEEGSCCQLKGTSQRGVHSAVLPSKILNVILYRVKFDFMCACKFALVSSKLSHIMQLIS